MVLTRSFTNKVNWMLDNLLPPFVRDSRLCMTPLFRLLFGGRARDFMEFKERAPFLSAEGLTRYYERLADCHLARETDLTPTLVEQVAGVVQRETVLDAGCGRGYLARRLVRNGTLTVTGMDICVAEGQLASANLQFCRGFIGDIPFRTAPLIQSSAPMPWNTSSILRRRLRNCGESSAGGSLWLFPGKGRTTIPLICISTFFRMRSASCS